MTDDIVKQLRDAAWCKNYNDGGNNPTGKLMEDAADEIEQLRSDVKTAIMGDSAELKDAKKEIERLREVLKPFSALKLPDYPNDTIMFGEATLGSSTSSTITLSQLRAAKKALEGK